MVLTLTTSPASWSRCLDTDLNGAWTAHGNTSEACVGGGMGWQSVPGDWVGVEGEGRFPLQDITEIKESL